MATVLIQHGEAGADGTPPPRAYFQLIEGKLHLPTIRDYFRLTNIALDGVVYPTDPEGFTFSTFTADTTVRVTGDAMPGVRLTRILLIRTSEIYGEPEQPGGKRKHMQAEENLGLWTLPPPESQPRTLTELTAALRSFLQIEHSITWLFKYRYFSDLVPIVSDSALAEAFDHFRAVAAQSAEDEQAASQQCRLYLNTTSEEMAPRDIIRARITGILDAAAAHSTGRESAAAAVPAVTAPVLPPAPLVPPPLQLPTPNDAVTAAAAAATAALLSGSVVHPQQHPQGAAAAAAALAAAGYAPYQLVLQPPPPPQPGDAIPGEGFGVYSSAAGGGGEDGDDGEDGEMQGENGGTLSGLLGIPRPSGSEGAMGGSYGATLIIQSKKESKTRHADGRFKNEAQHAKKMADMTRKIAELFDGAIAGMVEVADHKKIMCLVCNHACTAYSAYHTDCVRKHFLRHHEPTLRERGVDVGRWRKEYEVSQKVKRQQQHQMEHYPPPPLQGAVGIPGLPPGLMLGPGGAALPPQLALPVLLNSLNALAAAGVDTESLQRGLQAQLLSLAGLPVLGAADPQLQLPGMPPGVGLGGLGLLAPPQQQPPPQQQQQQPPNAQQQQQPLTMQQQLQSALQTAPAGAGGLGAAPGGLAGGGGGVPLQTVSALLMQAQAVSQDEQLQIQAAGSIPGLLPPPLAGTAAASAAGTAAAATPPSTASAGGGGAMAGAAPPVAPPAEGAAAQGLTLPAGPLGAFVGQATSGSGNPGGDASATGAGSAASPAAPTAVASPTAVEVGPQLSVLNPGGATTALATMLSLANGTVTTEMQPPQMATAVSPTLRAQAVPQGEAAGSGEAASNAAAAGGGGLGRSGGDHGGADPLPAVALPPVVPADMPQQSLAAFKAESA
ncbi:hypothetical protein Agub_g14693 [Astrephomene gubernaculifera]|uniref:Uncharacterized protein n=1 Tax=Astrephomene gubernaculifera TaxID=47775 RepID=A0AAD3HTD5_9CHLO|nr:hypothetical protein Agub_g14693 [Astrephomene gubernaculifera]